MRKSMKALAIGIVMVICLVGGYYWAIGKAKKPAYAVNTPQFIHERPDVVLRRLENGEQGVYYFGFADCPWCVELLPVLDEALAVSDLQAYAVDTKGKDFTETLRSRLSRFYARYYQNHLSVPFLVTILENGKVQTHVGTLEKHNAHEEPLTDKQKKELKKIVLALLR